MKPNKSISTLALVHPEEKLDHELDKVREIGLVPFCDLLTLSSTHPLVFGMDVPYFPEEWAELIRAESAAVHEEGSDSEVR
jgi:hypothetical protein